METENVLGQNEEPVLDPETENGAPEEVIDAQGEATETTAATDGGSQKRTTKRSTRAVDASARSVESVRDEVLREESNRARTNSRDRAIATVERLRTAYKNREILEGIISSVERIEGRIFAVVNYDVIRAFINFEQLFEANPMNYISKYTDDGTKETRMLISREALERREQFVSKMLGAKIEYVITQFESTKDSGKMRYLAIGSRKEAMRMRRLRYLDKASNGNTALMVGDEVTARIIAVGAHRLQANIYGKDVRIHKSNISNRFIPNLMDIYAPGEEIRVRLTKIEYDENGACKEVFASASEIEADTLRENLASVRVGSKYIATIVTVGQLRANDGYPYRLYIEGANVCGRALRVRTLTVGQELHSGDRVLVNITGKNEDYAFCEIIRLASQNISI